jgi:molybdopterin molybdotransferase
VATLGHLTNLQLAIASRGQPVPSRGAVPLRDGVGRVLARRLPRINGRGLLLDAGTTLVARHLPMIAQEGVALVPVHDRVRVGLLTLEDRSRAPRPGTRHVGPAIVATLLRGAVEQLGAAVVDETIASDGAPALAHALESLRAHCDLVLVIGFIGPTRSVELGAALDDRGLAWFSQDVGARPLGALQFAHCGTTPVVSLSPDLGNAFASFIALVSPLVRRIQGRSRWLPDVETSPLDGPMPLRNAWGFFCVTESAVAALGPHRLQLCKRGDSASAISEASGIAWRPLDLCLHREADVAYYPFHRWLR